MNNLTIAPCPCADHAVFFKHAHVWDKNGGDLLSYTLHRHQCRCSENLYTFHGGTSQLAAQLFQPLWSERDELWRRVRFVRASHVAAIICISTCFCKVVVLSSFVDTLLFCSRMKDRNFDMPYVMLRGKTFFVTYGWSLNNVCHVSAVPFYDVASITSFAVVAPQLHQHEVHLLCACMRTSVKRDNSFNCDYLDDTRIRFIRVLQVPQASQRFAFEGFPPFIL